MYICRLFHRDRPFQQIEARLLTGGAMTIGRDLAADWPMDDRDGTLSRIHCALSIEGDRLFLTDRSSNGTFLGNGERAPLAEPVEIEPREIIRLGSLSILIDRPPADASGDVASTHHVPLSTIAAPLPSDWSDAVSARPLHRDASLIEAFCDGAQLDASALSSEDPVELMRRVGAIYKQTLIGLGALMAERTKLKAAYQLELTTIAAANNNPFKWAPSRRLAQDLLCSHEDGFLGDADAVRASFADLSEHLAAVARGANNAMDSVLRTFSPEAIDAEVRSDGFSLKGKAAARWEVHNRRHAALIARDGTGNSDVTRAFNEGYAAGRSTD
jgi:predicted component of type VI protein secretion system